VFAGTAAAMALRGDTDTPTEANGWIARLGRLADCRV